MDQTEIVAEEGPAEATQIAPWYVPRFRIAHLLLWTLCTALYLSASQLIRSLSTELSVFDNLMDVSGVFAGTVIGAAIAGTGVLIYSRLQYGPPLCFHPGTLVITHFYLYHHYLDAGVGFRGIDQGLWKQFFFLAPKLDRIY